MKIKDTSDFDYMHYGDNNIKCQEQFVADQLFRFIEQLKKIENENKLKERE